MPGTTNDAPVQVQVTSQFMEDYVSGTRWLQSYGCDETFVAQNGSAQLLNLTRDPVVVVRVYPDSASASGWSVAQTPLQATPLMGVRSAPRVLVAPGRVERMLVYQTGSLQYADLAADGTPGHFTATPLSMSVMPLVRGQLPAGTRYVPEWAYPRAEINVRGGGQLRDLSDPRRAVPVEGGAFDYISPELDRLQVVPLRGDTPGLYRCVVVQNSGRVEYLALRLAAYDSAWRVASRQLLGTSTSKLVYVHDVDDGRVEVLMLELPRVSSITGHFAPADPAAISWDAAQPDQLPGAGLPAARPGESRSMVGVWDAETTSLSFFVTVTPPAGDANALPELWSTARASNGRWQPLALIDRGARAISALPTHDGRIGVWRARAGFEIWDRSGNGEYSIAEIRLPDEAGPPLSLAGYRVGVTLTRASVPMAGADVSFTASFSTAAVLRGSPTQLRTQQALAARTDGHGSVWLTVLLQDRLNAPTIYVASPLLDARFQIELNNRVHDTLAAVTADKLRQARDPRGDTPKPLLSDPGAANAAAQAITAMLAAVPQPPAVTPPPRRHTSGRSRLEGNVPVRFLAAGAPPIRTHTGGGTPAPPPSFSLTRAGYQHLSDADAQRRLNTIGVSRSVLSDAFDTVVNGIGDVLQAIKNKAMQIGELVFDGLKLTLRIAYRGLEYFYSTVIDTLERAMDGVVFVLDVMGAALGTALGWLLELLGGLFDWKAIKEKRDEIRRYLDAALTRLPSLLPKPSVKASAWAAQLDSLRAKLQTYRSTTNATRSFGSMLSPMPSMATLLSSGGGQSALPQASWIIDKVSSALPDLGTDIGLPDSDALRDSLATVVTKVASVGPGMQPGLDDLDTLIRSWIVDGQIFSSKALQPVIDIVLARLDALLAAIRELVTATGDALTVLLDESTKIVAWLGRPLRVPFFGSFYKALTGHEFSLLDLACLSAAIPAVVIGSSGTQPHRGAAGVAAAGTSRIAATAEDDARKGMREAGRWLMVASIATTAISAMSSASAKSNPLTKAVTALDLSCSVGSAACLAAASEPVALDIGAASVAMLAWVAYARAEPATRNAVKVFGQMALVLYNMIVATVAADSEDRNRLAFATTGAIKATVTAGIILATTKPAPEVPEEPLPWQAILAVGAVMGGLTGFQYWLFVDHPL